jgi:uncharacterized protein (TIGR02996 family)
MTDEEAFIQAIAQSPDDDVPRLIFADWLEERGDPRGKFIRVQCELAGMAPGNPRRPVLELRQRQLLAVHELEWVGLLRGFVDQWEFQRGLIDKVTMIPAHFVSAAETLFRLAPVRLIHFFRRNHVQPGEVKALASSPWLARLQGLKLNTDRGIRDGEVECIAACPHLLGLSILDLSDNWIENPGAILLAQSPYLGALKRLNLRRNPFGPTGAHVLQERFGNRVEL